MMFALVMIVVSLSSDVLALESRIRGQGMTDTKRDLKKDKKKKPKPPPLPPCFTGTQAQIIVFCSTNNCCSDGTSGCSAQSPGIFTVCAGACNGQTACDSVGAGAVINSGACVGYEACYTLGQQAAGNAVTVAAGACVGESACSGIGSRSGVTRITIGAGACQGEDACEDVGGSQATIISIAAGACTAAPTGLDGICEACDRPAPGTLSITGQQCPTF
jgi:hypothetical protein